MKIRNKELKFYIDGKEVGVCETNSLTYVEEENPKEKYDFRPRCTLILKEGLEIEMFMSRPERIRKYVKQIINFGMVVKFSYLCGVKP